MSAIVEYINGLPGDVQEVDLSAFELIEDFDEETWWKLKSNRKIKRLKLPPSLLTIRKEASENCSQLTEVTFPSSLRSIEDYAFHGCSALAMNDLKLLESLEECGAYAFRRCERLTGKLSTHITGNGSFARCRGLTDLIMLDEDNEKE
jgi:hypothetical protein